MRLWKPLLILLFVFFVGTFTGFLLSNIWEEHWREVVMKQGMVAIIQNQLRHNLHLTAEQTQQVHQILVDAQHQMHPLLVPLEPHIHVIRNAAQLKIEALLTPPQVEHFHDLLLENKTGPEGHPHRSPLQNYFLVGMHSGEPTSPAPQPLPSPPAQPLPPPSVSPNTSRAF